MEFNNVYQNPVIW